MTYATTAQTLEAFATLTDAELLALRKIASNLLGGTSYSEPLDLIHEALYRCLDGRRNWPVHVHFGVFLGNAMRSVAFGDRRLVGNRSGAAVAVEEIDAAPHCHGSRTVSPEEELIAFEALSIARKAADSARVGLRGDEPALKVLEGMLAGMSPREMCAGYAMDAKAFDAARHRVVRRLKDQRSMH